MGVVAAPPPEVLPDPEVVVPAAVLEEPVLDVDGELLPPEDVDVGDAFVDGVEANSSAPGKPIMPDPHPVRAIAQL
jgi:hypothetical protein